MNVRHWIGFANVVASLVALATALGCGKAPAATTPAQQQHGEHAAAVHGDDREAHAPPDDDEHHAHVHLGADSTPPADEPMGAAKPASATDEAAAVYADDIATAVLVRRPLVPTLGVPGRVEFDGDSLAQVGSPVPGRVVALPVSLGQAVDVDQVLLVIDSPEYGEAQSELLLRRSAVRAASPGVAVARSSYARAKALYDDARGIALTEVERREAELRAAEAALTLAQAGAAAAEAKLKLMGMSPAGMARLVARGQVEARHELRAAIAGTVIERRAVRGQLVGPTDPALLVIADPHKLWVTADVPEAAARGVRLQASASVRTSRETDDALPAQVAVVAAAVDPATRTLQVRLTAALPPTPSLALRPGMFVWAELDLANPDQADRGSPVPVLAVPASAVVEHEGRSQVFVAVAVERHTYVPRIVRVGPAIGGYRQVLAGLNEGERVVVRGAFLLKAEAGKAEAGHDD